MLVTGWPFVLISTVTGALVSFPLALLVGRPLLSFVGAPLVIASGAGAAFVCALLSRTPKKNPAR